MRNPVIHAATLAIFTIALAFAQDAGQSWLDAPIRNWNRAGVAIQRAPKIEFPQDCVKQVRAPSTSEEKTVERRGWKIPTDDDTPDRGAEVVIVMGIATADGMCRADEFQYFVFVNGKFAGTLAPAPMNPRTDGSLVRAAISGARGLTAEFVRYEAPYPLCCPSGLSRATYEIRQQNGKSVVALTNVATERVP